MLISLWYDLLYSIPVKDVQEPLFQLLGSICMSNHENCHFVLKKVKIQRKNNILKLQEKT